MAIIKAHFLFLQNEHVWLIKEKKKQRCYTFSFCFSSMFKTKPILYTIKPQKIFTLLPIPWSSCVTSFQCFNRFELFCLLWYDSPLIWFISGKNMLYPGRICAYEADKSLRTVTLSRLRLSTGLLLCRCPMTYWWMMLIKLCQRPSHTTKLNTDKFTWYPYCLFSFNI